MSGHLARAAQRVRGALSARGRAALDPNGLAEADYEAAAARAARVEAARQDDLLRGALATGTVQVDGKPVTP
ncbi:hypothetical protein [Cellulomonas sp. C5510]|uniref:hypothetical protein n=1 Tax=Cellulomonas sp. C5510 TaxID=2871170 RepID=UPI001C981F28|nr:hypothetical protein [Cellulomonas sp. C5510]QZN86937.1 hypothetical protein K5O09_07450 [Cellulomonas sp. C5510]